MDRKKARVTITYPDTRVRVFNASIGEVLEGPWSAVLKHIGDYIERGDRWRVDRVPTMIEEK